MIRELVELAELPTFGACVRTLRVQRGLSLCQTARMVPCDKAFLSRIEHDKAMPSLITARILDGLLKADGGLLAVLGQHLMQAHANKAWRRPPKGLIARRTADVHARNDAVFARVLGHPTCRPVAVAS